MAELAALIEQTVVGMGYLLVDFETSPRARLLRVFIERSADAAAVDSGVTVDDCAAVSNQLTRVLAVEDVDYDRLEVSSPGLDRVLRQPADFVRFAGRQAHIKLRVPLGTQRNFSGTLQGCEAGTVRLATADGELDFAFENVDKARLVPKF